jgi:putative inorganic carbon (HCO3(-)) transporter
MTYIIRCHVKPDRYKYGILFVMNVSAWCSRIIRTSFYLLFILVPLILTPWNYELFEYNKMVITYALAAIILGAWLIQTVNEGVLRIAKTPLDIPILLFVASQLVSALFSMDPHVSWFGYYSRFNGGMWSIFSYLILYYAFVTHFGEKIPPGMSVPVPVKKILNVMVATGAVVALYGVAEHFGIDKHLWVQDVQTRVFSTLGQPNWLAAFLAAVFPVSLYFFAANTTRATPMQVIKFLLGGATALLSFLVILFTRSRSGLLGLAVADLLFFLFIYLSAKEKKRVIVPFVAIHAIFAIIVFFNGIYVDQIDKWVTFRGWRDRFTHKQIAAPTPLAAAGTALESGGTESGTIRKYVWQAAVTAWRATAKNTLIGTGTETFAFAFYQYRPQGHNQTSEWDFLYNKAHNEYLNYVATTGLFGLGSYLVLIGTCIFWFITVQIKNKSAQKILPMALFAGWISILVTNFFGFSVVIIQLLFFLFPAIIIVLTRESRLPAGKAGPVNRELHISKRFSFAVLFALLVVFVLIYSYWKADTLYSTGYRLARANQFAQAETYTMRAISLNPGEPVYHDEAATTLGSLAVAAVEAKNATLAASLAKQSLTQSDTAIRTSPKNVNFWKTRTKLYYTFSTFDPQLNQAAIDALLTAQTLSPNDPKIIYNLAILYGRQGNNTEAVKLLTQAKTLKPDYRDAYFGLYVFYTEMKQSDAARAELQYYLDHVDPTDRDFQSRLAQ